MEIIQKSDSGIALAWYLATLGPRRSQKKLLAHSISNVCIPTTCNAISSLGSEKMNLRLSSNLLYGLSLIYKQKVECMLTEVGSVHSRLTAPQFQLSWRDPAHKISKTSSGPVYLKDDQNFNPDFLMELPLEIMSKEDSLANLDRILKIKQRDNERNFINDAPPLSLTADERDRLFSEFMELTTLSLRPEVSENDNVTFEFDANGQLVGENNDHNIDQNVLDGINFDEDYVSSAVQVDDISKSVSGTNDPHFSTTLDVTLATKAMQQPQRKKRKIIIDEDCHLRRSVIPLNHLLVSDVKSYTNLGEVIRCLSTTSPPFLNLCMRLIYGMENTRLIDKKNFPSRQQLSGPFPTSELHDVGDIELGRNVPISRRQSSDNGLHINENEGDQNLDIFVFGAFDLQLDWDPVESNDQLHRGEETDSPAQSLLQFQSYVKEMVDSNGENNGRVSFEALVPSSKPGEPNTTRKIAAAAFASVLQLSTKGNIDILQGEGTDSYMPCHPRDIVLGCEALPAT